ncbi:MAG: SUMF1/EgtB/PvdO family nonheme iron enzyme [Planctomycetota bacterium]
MNLGLAVALTTALCFVGIVQATDVKDDLKAAPEAMTLVEGGICHVLRGGSWFFVVGFLRCADRCVMPVSPHNHVGFRLARSVVVD